MHYLRFRLSDAERDAFRDPSVPVMLSVEHDHYSEAPRPRIERSGPALELKNLFGLPAHPLLVHLVVVLVPLVAIGTIGAAISASVRARVGWLLAAGAVGNVVLVPLVSGSGESLQGRVSKTDLVRRHTRMGGELLPWVIGLAVVFVVLMLRHRYAEIGATSRGIRLDLLRPTWLGVVLAALSILIATGATLEVVRIGHSGAKASWSDVKKGRSDDREGDGAGSSG